VPSDSKYPTRKRGHGHAVLLASARIAVLLALSSELAHGTTYMRPRWPLTRPEAIEEAFANADAVILGRILESRFEDVPFGGGFVGKRTLVVSVAQVLKGNTSKNQIEVSPGMPEGLGNSLSVWRDQRSLLVMFLGDTYQLKLDRRDPQSGKASRSHEWFVMQFSHDHSIAILDPSSDRRLMARLEEMKRDHSLEGATRQADLVVIGNVLPKVVPCVAFGDSDFCRQVSVERVLKGQLMARVIAVVWKGFGTPPDPAAPAIYFLRSQNGTTFEIMHFKAGAKPIRGNRLRESGVSLDEAIARIQAAAR
jgi:hypothetical protein